MSKANLCLSIFALAAAGACHAQSSVKFSGIVDLDVQRMDATGKGHATQVGNSGLNTSRLIFSGTEDLGGGLYSGFWLEGGLNPDNGTGRANNSNNQPSGAVPASGFQFDRRSYVDLGGNWGELRVGRDFVFTQYTNIYYDAFNTNGVGRIGNFTYSTVTTAPLPTTITVANSFSYWTPHTLGGFYGNAMVGLGENPSNSPQKNDGRIYSVRAGYGRGPFDFSAAYSRTSYVPTTTIGNYRQANVGGSWDFKVAKLFALYNDTRVQLSTGAVRKDTWSVGVRIPVGPGVVRASYARLNDRSAATLRNANGSLRSGNDASQYALGYIYNLSKRTALYGTYARISNRGQAAYLVAGGIAPAPGGHSSGLEFGLRHSF
jgi:predicted porin